MGQSLVGDTADKQKCPEHPVLVPSQTPEGHTLLHKRKAPWTVAGPR